jgi:hypothetical protein
MKTQKTILYAFRVFSLELVKEILAKTHYAAHNIDWQTSIKLRVRPGAQEE